MSVDAVFLLAEHSDYPTSEKGQKLYPRYEFFRKNIYRQDGTAVAVFNDKHLSYSFEKAQRMVLASKELQFPFLAGSSLPATFRLLTVKLRPRGCTYMLTCRTYFYTNDELCAGTEWGSLKSH